MDLKGIFNTYIGMIKLDGKAYKTAAQNNFGGSALIFLITAVAIALGIFWSEWSVGNLVGGTISNFIGFIVAIAVYVGIVWIFAKIFGGKGKYATHYNSGSFLVLGGAAMIVPVIGPLVAVLLDLWGIVMHIFVVKEVHKLSTGKAAIAVLLPVVILFVLFAIIALVAGAAFLGYLTAMYGA